jgi:hypothetical protein
MNVLRISRHGVATSMASACMVETVDMAPSMKVAATPRQTFFELDLVVPGA